MSSTRGPTNFPNGVSTAKRQSLMGLLPVPDPQSVHMLHDDFILYAEPPYTSTVAGAATVGLVDSLNGALQFTCTSNVLDVADMSPEAKTFRFDIGRQIWFEMSLRVTVGSNIVAIHFGLQDAQGHTPPNGWHITKDSGQDNYHVAIRSGDDDQVTPLDLDSFVLGDQVVIGFHWDGVDTITNYFEDVAVNSFLVGDGSSPNLPQLPLGTLFPTFGVEGSGEASDTQLHFWTAAAIS